MPRLKRASSNTAHVLLAALALALGAILLVPGVLRTVGSKSKFFIGVPPTALRVCRCDPASTFRLRRPDGVELVIDSYHTHGRSRKAALIFLHGNVPNGRRVAMYRVLATELARRGYSVYLPDFAGFGASGDPFETLGRSGGQPSNLDDLWFADIDVLSTLEYVSRSHPGLSIGIIGHSGGAEPALSVGTRDARVEKMVLMGPPADAERLARDSSHSDQLWRRALDQRARLFKSDFPVWFTQDVWEDLRSRRTLEDHADYLAREGHKPVLLLHGAEEKLANREWLRSFAAAAAPPLEYWTIPYSDHYGNAKNFLGLCLYDRRVAKAATDALDAWFGG